MTEPDCSPRPPADLGLGTLGLLTSLGGALTATVTALVLASSLHVDGLRPLGFLWLIASVVRGLVCQRVGRAMWLPRADDPPLASSINGYVVVGMMHTALYWLATPDGESPRVGALVLFLCWPIVLFVVGQQHRVRLLGPRPPLARDGGVEAMGVVMTAFAVAGLLVALAMLRSAREIPGNDGLVMTLLAAALGARALVHLLAGVAGLRAAPALALDRFARNARLGRLAANVTGVGLLWQLEAWRDDRELARGAALFLMLWAWPAHVSAFVADRRQRVPPASLAARAVTDGGHNALGWLLGSLGVLTLASQLARNVTPAMLPTLFDDDARWLLFLVLGLQLWAAVELIGVSARRRTVAGAWAVASLVLTLVTQSRLLDIALDGNARDAAFAALGLGLVLVPPVVTLALLVGRASALPPARVVRG
jgi:hypothetical protein